MKKAYEKPVIEVVIIEQDDIFTDSYTPWLKKSLIDE